MCSISQNSDHRELHSFPTRRSSDLKTRKRTTKKAMMLMMRKEKVGEEEKNQEKREEKKKKAKKEKVGVLVSVAVVVRSEEHTSELQSHVNLVCRLLLEKKKKVSEYK